MSNSGGNAVRQQAQSQQPQHVQQQTPQQSQPQQTPQLAPRHAQPQQAPQQTQAPQQAPRHAQPQQSPTQQAPRKRRKSRYVPALDGLRALAVIAVIFYHLDAPFAQGGLIGVTVFFVLSGYLITGILAGEIHASGKVDLANFWLRRVRRLFPAIVLTVVGVAFLCVLFNHALLTKMRPDILPSLFWFQNWWYVIRDLSYFEALGSPSPLTHFWSLAIEEQFYLVWPIILMGLYKLFGRRSHLVARTCLVLAIVSAVWMGVLYDPTGDPTRVYYGTDTRAFSLLVGAYLSFIWPANNLQEKGDPAAWRERRTDAVKLLDAVGTFALVVLIAMMVFAEGTSAFMYCGGLALASVLTAFVMAALVLPDSALAHLFALKPLVWIGERSYGMYLWHFPVILLLKPLSTAESGYDLWIWVAAFAITFVVSALSYKYVENPIRKGALGNAWRAMREAGAKVYVSAQPLVGRIACGAFAVVLVATCVGCTAIPDTSEVPEYAITSTGDSIDEGMDVEEQVVYSPVLIGDSIVGSSQDEFSGHFSNGLLDAYEGRTLSQSIDVYVDYREQGCVGHVVVFASFTNHKIQDGQLDRLYNELGEGRELFVVTVKSPDDLETYNNNALSTFAAEHDNVHLIDWYSVCSGHVSEYLWNDKTHLRPEGVAVYQQLVYEAVKDYLEPTEDETEESTDTANTTETEEA